MTAPTTFRFTHHALQRALDMLIEPATIRAALETPDKIKPSLKYPHCDLYDYGNITLSVDREVREVVTILWNGTDAWFKDCVDGPKYAGREFRPSDPTLLKVKTNDS